MARNERKTMLTFNVPMTRMLNAAKETTPVKLPAATFENKESEFFLKLVAEREQDRQDPNPPNRVFVLTD
jgi:hypothetical protein